MSKDNKNIIIDHADIVTSHKCNGNCKHCIDSFIHSSDEEIKAKDITKFLEMLRRQTKEPIEILLLGGEPTMLSAGKLVSIANLVHSFGFKIVMSTNGIFKPKIRAILRYFDSVQITMYSDKDIEYWRPFGDKINAKLSGDKSMTLESMNHFIELTERFSRRSVSMYFTPDFRELCEDPRVWDILNSLDWERNGSYKYAFYRGVRFKKCIHGVTNIADEPTIPKLYPNGNYNKTWRNEEMDDYLNWEG